MKVTALSIVETSYRGTLEEQDDTILWLNQSLRSAGAHVDVLLKGSAVNYAVKRQDASGLAFGDERQTQPPRLADDVQRLIASGVTVYLVREDAEALGLERSDLVEGLEHIERAALASLLRSYDRVWYW